jgi:hypothetical protein
LSHLTKPIKFANVSIIFSTLWLASPPAGVVRRVLILILVMVAMGVGLFYWGLEYLFPKY